MRLVLISDTFPPLRTSGAVQLRDLARELVRQGHELTVLLPGSTLHKPYVVEQVDGARIVRLKSPKTKDIGYIQRTLNEFRMSFAMRRNLQHSPLINERWDGVLWYAPSIFHGPLVRSLKKASGCKGYLIIRDIFPDWAVDMGLMGRGLPYLILSAVARYQYSVADIIGVQSLGNRIYFNEWEKRPGRSLEVLSNWLGDPASVRCRIRISETMLAGRKIFVYAGNMGVAQGMDIILSLAHALKDRLDIGFVFVGRGRDAQRLAAEATRLNLPNVLFFDEIDPDEIPDLYQQCHVGLVSLDSRHRSHNIPGKFLTYMQSGIPVLASINAGNDLAELIRRERVGRVVESNSLSDLVAMANELLLELDSDVALRERSLSLFRRNFSVASAAAQVAAGLSRAC